jgi:hypothetical protein
MDDMMAWSVGVADPLIGLLEWSPREVHMKLVAVDGSCENMPLHSTSTLW